MNIMLKGLRAVSADGEYNGSGSTNRRLSVWQRVHPVGQALLLIGAIAGSSFAGGALSREWGDLPSRVAANDSIIEYLDATAHELREQVQADIDRSETLWLYTVCRIEGHDGQCEWILPADLQVRLRNIRLFIQSAPSFQPRDGNP